MTGEDFLNIAEKIGALSGEAAQRSVVSRAYFGAFHAVRDWLADLGFVVTRNDSSHSEISRWLVGSGHSPAIEIGRRIGILRAVRNRADYDLNDPASGSSAFAAQHLASGRWIIASIASCNAEPARSAIIAGIQAYRARIAQRGS
jgi:hypothetical protein